MTATITSEQVKQFKRFVEDAADRALKEVAPDKEGLQALFRRGGEFQAFVREGIHKFSAKEPVFPVYLDIEVGGKSKDQLLEELQTDGHCVSDRARDIMSKSAWKPGKREQVKFARATVHELGFTKNPTMKKLWARIREVGALCEPSDGPAIRRAVKDQSQGDYFSVAMEQINDSLRDLRVFGVERTASESLLDAEWRPPGRVWRLGSGIVFRLRE